MPSTVHPVRWSIAIPQLGAGPFDAEGVRAHLARAEELGFEGAWTMELTVGAAPVLAPLEVLAYAAACTERLRLGGGGAVGPPPPRGARRPDQWGAAPRPRRGVPKIDVRPPSVSRIGRPDAILSGGDHGRTGAAAEQH